MLQRWIVCGLGNPGRRYLDTRHNMGFLLLDYLTGKYSLSWAKPVREYSFCEYESGTTYIVFIKPETYMNLSGEALRAFGANEAFQPHEVLVLCDDFALPLGRIRLRRKGSDGGHNGLRSVIKYLSSQEFPRLRMGVGPVPEGMDPADYVLSSFLEEEMDSVHSVLGRAAECVKTLVEEGFDKAMGEFNAPPFDNEFSGEID